MDLIDVASEVRDSILQFRDNMEKLDTAGDRKAEAIAQYDLNLAKTIIKLRRGVEFKLEEETVKSPPATLIPKVAAGICWREKLELETSDAVYRNLIQALKSLEAQLNGWQSILRRLDQV